MLPAAGDGVSVQAQEIAEQGIAAVAEAHGFQACKQATLLFIEQPIEKKDRGFEFIRRHFEAGQVNGHRDSLGAATRQGLVAPICRLDGGVYGGATDLALACDFRIGVDSAEMFMPAALRGLHYYRSGIARYVSRLGADNAKMLFLTAQKIAAPEMLRIGYLTAMVPREALDAEVDKLADILGGNAPVAMAGMKRTINEFARGELDEAAADRRHRDSMRGAEIKEGIKAFADKRAPRF